MKKLSFLISFSLALCSIVWNSYADGVSNYSDRDSALYFLVHQNYKSAQIFLEKHTKNYPADNEALYLSFVIEQTRILDFESYMSECDTVVAIADSLRKILEKRLSKLHGQDYTECLLCIANLMGGVSIILSKTGNWFEAVKSALNSVAILKKVKKLDPDCYEANLGIGVFDYYIGSSFKWLPFVQDKGKEGIKLLEKATNARYPYNYAAKSSLCWILIEQGDLERADSLAKSVLDELPDNTLFLRIRAYILLWNGKYDLACKTAERIINCAERRVPVNWSDLVTGTTILVNSLVEQKDTKRAYIVADAFWSKMVPQQYLEMPHIKKNVNQITEAQQKCSQ